MLHVTEKRNYREIATCGFQPVFEILSWAHWMRRQSAPTSKAKRQTDEFLLDVAFNGLLYRPLQYSKIITDNTGVISLTDMQYKLLMLLYYEELFGESPEQHCGTATVTSWWEWLVYSRFLSFLKLNWNEIKPKMHLYFLLSLWRSLSLHNPFRELLVLRLRGWTTCSHTANEIVFILNRKLSLFYQRQTVTLTNSQTAACYTTQEPETLNSNPQ